MEEAMPNNDSVGFVDHPPSVPVHLHFREQPEVKDDFKCVQLPVKGQGVVVFTLTDRQAFKVKFTVLEESDGEEKGSKLAEVELVVEPEGAPHHTRLFVTTDKQHKPIPYEDVFVDKEKKAEYWVSVFAVQKGIAGAEAKGEAGVFLKYGVGEVRLELANETHPFIRLPDAKKPTIKDVHLLQNLDVVRLQRDPVVMKTPMVVVPTDTYTIEDADKGNHCVPANLTPVCQKLYDNVSGKNFLLNTPDFRDFTTAIEHSIADKNGWCYKKLHEKAKNLHEKFKETYLRITVGKYQGESPGIPYVVEIWPPGHHSPIHNHASSNAIIRVLYGGIHVSLYPMLSKHHKIPFMETDFYEGDVTWISPTLNQTHMLKNINRDGPTCITIQCYMYDTDNTAHYDYFDYLKKHHIDQFLPTSDADYSDFKEIIRKEWEGHKSSGITDSASCERSVEENPKATNGAALEELQMEPTEDQKDTL